jgi:NAD(P)H-nitrite reductase large subunit
MLEGAGYIKTLVDKKVPYRVGWTIVEAHGQERVCEAVIAKLSPNGKILPETKQTLQVDTVVSGYGLTPSTEICRLVNCEMTFSAGRGGYVPSRNAKMQTSLPGIYAAGDGAGIGGAGLSMIEGRIVGGAIAEKLGKINEQEFQRITEKDRKLMKREEKFAKFLGDVFSPPDELYQLADDETIICRCEQITLREIKEAISCGAQSLGDVKSLTRSGMGNCQGRTCASIIAHILAAESGRSLQESRYNSVRPPIHPLPMSVIEEYDLNVSDYSAAGSHNHA